MGISHEDEYVTELEKQRLLYHAPRLVSLGSVKSLVQLGLDPGSDGGGLNDCAFS